MNHAGIFEVIPFISVRLKCPDPGAYSRREPCDIPQNFGDINPEEEASVRILLGDAEDHIIFPSIWSNHLIKSRLQYVGPRIIIAAILCPQAEQFAPRRSSSLRPAGGGE